MLISKKLATFYDQNNLSENGGEKDTHFLLKFKLFSLKIPNSDFRKKVIHIHDVQHILYDKDVTWKGEAFIAGWEIATNMWKHFPIGLLSLWAMGFSVLIHFKEVLKGYKEGLLVTGIIDLNISKETILNYDINAFKTVITKAKPTKFNWFLFVFWVTTSVLLFSSPVFFTYFATFIFIGNVYSVATGIPLFIAGLNFGSFLIAVIISSSNISLAIVNIAGASMCFNLIPPLLSIFKITLIIACSVVSSKTKGVFCKCFVICLLIFTLKQFVFA